MGARGRRGGSEDLDVSQCRSRADLDELLARYVLPMNDLTEDVCRHRKYDAELHGPPDAASEKLMALRRAAPSSIPYVLWVDPRYPGRFALTYLAPRASRPKNEWVKVTPRRPGTPGTEIFRN